MKLLPVTALSSWVHCPNQFYANYVLKIEEPPKDVMILGLLKHKLHEHIAQEEQRLITTLSPADNVEETFHAAFIHILKDLVNKHTSMLRRVNVSLVDAFQKSAPIVTFEARDKAARVMPHLKQGLTGEQLWHALTPKVKTEYSVQSERLGIKGRIDKLEYSTGTLLPVELKSGTPPDTGVWNAHRVQAAAYALMLEDKFATPVSQAVVHYIDHNSRRPVHVNPFLKDELQQLIATLRDCYESQQPPAGCGRENCTACHTVKQVQHNQNATENFK